MANITYAWNPFQERIDCRIDSEDIKVTGDVRREFVPRNAPFFAKDFVLFRKGSNVPLVPGIDYVFGHPFDRFIQKYNKNVYGSVILIKDIQVALQTSYDTIGSPFVLNEVAYATLIANIANSPRQANWDLITGVPFDFPPDPHPHPAAQTYDYLQMCDYLKNLVLSMTETGGDQLSTKLLLEEHMNESLDRAHNANKTMIGLDLTPNARMATIEDIGGNSADTMVPMSVVMEMFRRNALGTLNLNQ